MQQTNNINSIVVHIKDEAMLQEAREILERYGENIAEDGTFELDEYTELNYLYYYSFEDYWLLSISEHTDKQITLPELEQRLKQQYEENKQIAINLTKGA